MRISLALYSVPKDFAPTIASGVLPNGTRFRKHYTGLAPLDSMLSFLVGAFLYGPTGWNEAFYWQQVHFLVQITGIIGVMGVEVGRERNGGRWLRFTCIFAVPYQNIGGAVDYSPSGGFLLTHASSPDAYFARGRAVPLLYARLLLPATVLIYVVPSVAIYVPGLLNLHHLQGLLAFWQLTPVFVNVPLWFTAPFISSGPSRSTVKNADLPHLKALYAVTGLIGVAVHWVTIFSIATSTNPEMTFSSVFLLNTDLWTSSFDWGFMFVFQWDWIICATAHVVPAFIAVYDAQRLLHGAATSAQLIKGGAAIAGLTLLGGPCAALTAVWAWREEKLVLIEERLESGKKRI